MIDESFEVLDYKLQSINSMSEVSLNLIDAYVKSGEPEAKQAFMYSMGLIRDMLMDYSDSANFPITPEPSLEESSEISPETP